MNFFSVSPTGATTDGATEGSATADSGSPPIANYGSLGPGSDVVDSSAPSSHPTSRMSFGPALAIAIGVLLAGLITSLAHSRGSGFANPFSSHLSPRRESSHRDSGADARISAKDTIHLDGMKPQKQAETLLELAVAQSDGAIDQISSRVDRWQGKLKWNSQIATLSAAALNSSDMRVRESGVEIELAAYGLGKNPASLDYLLRTARSSDHAQKVWALWALGLMGNRGVETERVIQALAAHLKDTDEDSRRWTVEGLALTGTNQAIPLLLQAMHNDPSPSVRERAACGLAQSGMFTSEQRFSAIPQLLDFTDDSALDSQTHAWAFQALGDITQQRLPNDAAAWRSWYEEKVASGQ